MLTTDMMLIIQQSNLAFAATKNEDGTPNLSPKSTLRRWDDNHLIFANLASPGTISNLKRDPYIEINCVDVFSRRGYRFAGIASIHTSGDTLYEKFCDLISRELGPATLVHDAVLIKLTSVKPVLSPAYEKQGVTEEGLRKTYLKRYGVND